ncbi:MAG: hypothetical protein KGL19_00785 [Bacteroidota bacterium]|nr:hypothetical protein [Bacteroidota bacterium]
MSLGQMKPFNGLQVGNAPTLPASFFANRYGNIYKIIPHIKKFELRFKGFFFHASLFWLLKNISSNTLSFMGRH